MKLYMKGHEPLKINWLCFDLHETCSELLQQQEELTSAVKTPHTFTEHCCLKAAAGEANISKACLWVQTRASDGSVRVTNC